MCVPAGNPADLGDQVCVRQYFRFYRSFYCQYRYFEPASEFNIVEYKGKRIALSICEDLWNLGNENPLYTIVPLDEMMPHKPDLILNLSASPFTHSHAEERIHVLRENAKRYNLPMFYVNQFGSQTEIIFDGGSIAFSPKGTVYEEMPYWVEMVKTFDLDDVIENGQTILQPKDSSEIKPLFEEIPDSNNILQQPIKELQ